jgi:signal transduction histidine kinase
MTEATPDRQRITIQPDPAEPVFEIYHLSHDLRGPLNSILGFTELLLEEIEGPLNDVQREDIAAINQSAQNLLRLINNTVDLSKLAASRLELNLGEVYLEEALNNVLAADFWAAKKGQAEVEVRLPDSLPVIWGDSSRVEAMLEELLGVACKLRGVGQIIITANNNPVEVGVRIYMPGVILTASELDDLFKLMVKADPGGRSHIGPGGMELPLVRRLAEKHGGRAWATAESAGTAFHLTLPIAETK